MSWWITESLGNGLWSTADGDDPSQPPKVEVVGEIQATESYSTTGLTVKRTLGASPTTLLVLDESRKSFTVFNRVGFTAILLGSGNVSTELLTTVLTPNTYYESRFRGVVTAISESGTSELFVTELL